MGGSTDPRSPYKSQATDGKGRSCDKACQFNGQSMRNKECNNITIFSYLLKQTSNLIQFYTWIKLVQIIRFGPILPKMLSKTAERISIVYQFCKECLKSCKHIYCACIFWHSYIDVPLSLHHNNTRQVFFVIQHLLMFNINSSIHSADFQIQIDVNRITVNALSLLISS